MAGLVVLLFLFELLPLTASDPSEPTLPTTTYGVYDDLASFQAEKDTRYNSPEVLRETRDQLDRIQPRRIEKTGPSVDYTLVDTRLPDISAPPVFDEAQNNTSLNGTSIIQFLLDQPLSYWVYTDMGGIRTWSKGFIRPSLDFTIGPNGISLLDWERWVEVDADHIPATGDASGSELRARLSLVVENYTFIPPQISTTPPFLSNWSLDFTGGIRLEVQRRTNTTARIPIEVAFLKSFMYRGLAYIWMTSFNFSDLPAGYDTALLAEKVKAGGSVMEILGNILQNFGLGNGSLLADIGGPYKVQVHTAPLEAVSMMVGYAKVANLRLEERSWIRLLFSVSPGSSALPQEMELWLDSPGFTSSFNHARWSAGGRCRLEAQMVENQANITYATISFREVPTFMELRLDNNSMDGSPNSLLHFESSSPISYLEYNEYELYDGSTSEYKHTHTKLEDLPTNLTLTGTFEVGGSAPQISNPIGIGFVSRILDNLMTRLAGKFYRIARTLRSIPENLVRMPESTGWTLLQIPSDQQIGSVEIWITSGPFVMRNGSFLAFYNLTLPPSDNPLMKVSFSLRLGGIQGLVTDFRRGSHIDLRTSAPQEFFAVFIDRSRGSNASVDISKLPTRFVVDIDRENRTLAIFSGDAVDRLTYLGSVGEQFLRISLEGLPESFSVVQRPDQFSLNSTAGQSLRRLEVLSTNSELYSLEGNYLLVKSGQWGTSFGASFSGLKGGGYSTGPDGKLELSLDSPVPLQVYIDNETEQLRARLLIAPMPSSISIGMSNLLKSGGIRVPDIMNATSVLGFSSAVFAITSLGGDVLSIASQVAGFVDEQMAGIGQNSTLAIGTVSETVLVGDIQKGNITEAPWTHGITSRHVEVPGKNTSYYNTKLFLRLARETALSTRSDGDSLNFSIVMKGLHSWSDWMLIDLEGISGRDLFAYLTGLPTGKPQNGDSRLIDLRLDGNITHNATYGRDLMKADLNFTASRSLGPFLASLSRNPPVNTRVLVFASALVPGLRINACMAERFSLRYSAMSELRDGAGKSYLYLKSSRLVDERWRSSTLLLHDIPKSVEASLSPPEGFDAGSAPSQALPEFQVSADRDILDLFVDMDGKATGQRSSYQLELKDSGKAVTGRQSGNVYKVRSTGTEEVYLRARDMPIRKGLSISAMSLYGENIQDLDLKISMVFGGYPVFELGSIEADSIHLSVRTKMSIGGSDREGKLILLDYRSSNGLPLGVQMFINGLSWGPLRNEAHLLVPLPLVTMLWTLLAG